MHPELREPAAFQRTQLCMELLHCQRQLHDAGADQPVQLQLTAAAAARAAAPTVIIDQPSATTLPQPAASAAAMATHPNTDSAPPSAARTRPPAESPPSSTCALLSSRFPSPSKALTQSIDDSWRRAVCDSRSSDMRATAAAHLQHDLTRSLEAAEWMRLFNSCGRYQQATLTALTLNPATSTWLSTMPISSEPGYRIRDEDYRLAIRHRLGQLPYDSVRSELCTACARRDIESPSLLVDPDHAHSCVMQEGVSVRRRHDSIKLALAQLARDCGYHVEVEPQFPTTFHSQLNQTTGRIEQRVHRPQTHGDLLLIRDNTRQLIDVTVVRPTSLTRLRGPAASGVHLQPLVAASAAERTKHASYDAECARHGWKLVPFALESLGAKGDEAIQLLQRMSAHSVDKSPEAFLQHADRMLSCALQTGNAGVSAQGTGDMLLRAYRSSSGDRAPSHVAGGRGPGANHARRAAAASCSRITAGDFGAAVHAGYNSARCNVQQRGAA